MSKEYDVFVSYARRDGLRRAELLDNDLTNSGFKTWRDKRDLDPEEDFTAELEYAIENSTRMVCCITPDTRRHDSFVRREISYALALGTPIIPLIFEDTLPPIHIINITREDFSTRSWAEAISSLVLRLRRVAEAGDALSSPPIDAYRAYLNALYTDIVSVLKQTVFTEITLRGETIPGASCSPPARTRGALPSAFWSITGATPDCRPTERFANFREAYERFEGRILLLGEPGGGKTTTLLAFARDRVVDRLHSPQLPLPIIAPISTWTPNPPQPLAAWLASQSPMLHEETIASLLDRGAVLVMCDGLDELGTSRRDPNAEESYDPRRRFLDVLPSTGKLVVTCRTRDFASIGMPFRQGGAIALKQIDDEQLRLYLAEMPALRDAVASDVQLRDVIRTPLLLGILTAGFQEHDSELKSIKDLKAAPCELREGIFEAFVHRRFEHEERRRHTPLPFDISTIYAGLGRAAVDGADVWLGTGSMGIQESLQRSYRDLAASFVEQARQLNLLIEGPRQELAFRHALLRDHFGFKRAFSFVRNWKLNDESVEITETWMRDHLLWKSFELLANIGDPRAIEPLLNHVQTSDDGRVPWPLAESLCKFADPRIVVAYARTLSSSHQYRDGYVSYLAAEGLPLAANNVGLEAATGSLLSAISTGTAEARADFVLAIGILGLRSALSTLITMMREEDAELRGCVAWALGRFDDPRARVALNELSDDTNTFFRGEYKYPPGRSVVSAVGEIAREQLGRSRQTQPSSGR